MPGVHGAHLTMPPLPSQPGTDPDRFTIRELIEESQRETRMRRKVFRRQVLAGKMGQTEADRKIDLMEAITRRLIKTAAL